ncbi:MAG: bacteriohemerythrin [Magnetovibrionaceae bacterium]
MADFRWLEAFDTGLEPIDRDHKAMVDLAGRIEDADRTGKFEERSALLGELNELSRTHFAREEEMLGRIGYPDVEGHARHHASCLERLESILARWTGPKSADSKSIEEIVDSLIVDLIKADMEFKTFAQEKGRI